MKEVMISENLKNKCHVIALIQNMIFQPDLHDLFIYNANVKDFILMKLCIMVVAEDLESNIDLGEMAKLHEMPVLNRAFYSEYDYNEDIFFDIINIMDLYMDIFVNLVSNYGWKPVSLAGCNVPLRAEIIDDSDDELECIGFLNRKIGMFLTSHSYEDCLPIIQMLTSYDIYFGFSEHYGSAFTFSSFENNGWNSDAFVISNNILYYGVQTIPCEYMVHFSGISVLAAKAIDDYVNSFVEKEV